MIVGAHIYLWARLWSDGSLDLLDRAKLFGLDFLKIAWGDDVSFTPRRNAQHARELGLELVLGPGALWPMECDISLEARPSQQRGLDWHRRAIDRSGKIGVVAYTGAICGHPGRVERRKPTDDEYRRVSAHLHTLAEYASRQRHSAVCDRRH